MYGNNNNNNNRYKCEMNFYSYRGFNFFGNVLMYKHGNLGEYSEYKCTRDLFESMLKDSKHCKCTITVKKCGTKDIAKITKCKCELDDRMFPTRIIHGYVNKTEVYGKSFDPII